MYSVNRIGDDNLDQDEAERAEKSARRHQDISPELKEVMHLLKAIESDGSLK